MELMKYYRQIRGAGFVEEAATLLYLIGTQKKAEERRELFNTILELINEGKLPPMEV